MTSHQHHHYLVCLIQQILLLKMFQAALDDSGIKVTAEEIASIMTPSKGDKSSDEQESDTPSEECSDAELNGSYSQQAARKPLGRFLSFDVNRTLFRSKRLAEELSACEDSPTTKKLKETEVAIGAFRLDPLPASSPGSDSIKSMVHRLSSDPELVGDGSRQYLLPTVSGRHGDVRTISPETVNEVLCGCYSSQIDEATVIDCRYPYEYDGGHIQGAMNLYSRENLMKFLTNHHRVTGDRRHVLILHCEFSSERAPRLYRFVRDADRTMNKDHYPRLDFPEMYVMDGGYKAFYAMFKDKCFPPSYKPMLHKDHMDELRHFRQKSKSWTAGEKIPPSRLSLRF